METINNGINCTASTNHRIVVVDLPDPVLSASKEICNGQNGSVSVINNGNPVSSYQWYDSNNEPLGNTANLSGLSSGNYYVTISAVDERGNRAQKEVEFLVVE